MQLKRLRCLLSPTRLRACFRYFRNPWRAFVRTASLGKRPFCLTLKSGRSLTFSRQARDHKLWDWLLTSQPPVDFWFTTSGRVQLQWGSHTFLLRPGTQDVVIFQEILLDDVYGIRHLSSVSDSAEPAMKTVIDLGANAGLFSCALLGRAERIIAVEPVGENYRQAVENIGSGGGNIDDIFRLAVSAASGKQITIQYNLRNSGGHTAIEPRSASHDHFKPAVATCLESALHARPQSDKRHRQEIQSAFFEVVESISLTDLMRQTDCDQVDLLKSDIEGSEFEVFLSTPASELRRIRRLVMEVHLSTQHSPQLLDELINHFRSAGFAVTLPADALSQPMPPTLILNALQMAHPHDSDNLPPSTPASISQCQSG